MNFIRRWRHGTERNQEQLLVKLWTINTLDAEDHTEDVVHPARLSLAARSELRSSLKYLSAAEVEQTVALTVSENAYKHQVLHNLRRQLAHGRVRETDS